MVEGLSSEFWNVEGMETQLSDSEKALRDLFIKEYLLDFDPVAACLRVGFINSFASDYAKLFMAEPYVQRGIAKSQREAQCDDDLQLERDKQLTLSVLRQAAQNGPFSSRVAAASKLAAILGMDAPQKSQQEILHRGGVMMVPTISNVDDWEREAQKSQFDLMDISTKSLH